MRSVYDEELKKAQKAAEQSFQRSTIVDIKQDVLIRIQDFLEGTSLDIHIDDPANPNGTETYQLNIPEETAPGTKFRLKREAPFENGYVIARVKARPDFRFKTRGSDLRCDLNINHSLATTGGTASVNGAVGNYLQIEIPENCARGEIIKMEEEGLPKMHGGRGDLLVRIMYRPEVRVSKASPNESAPPRRRLR